MRQVLTIVLFLFALLIARPVRSSVCKRNAQAGDLQVDHYVSDALLHRKWAIMVDCGHPERPWTSVAVPWRAEMQVSALRPVVTDAAKAIPLVAAGAKVRLWRTADGANIELSGTALEAGAEGQAIHIRTGRRGTVLEGTVRGAGSVELRVSEKLGNWSAQ